jgi:hypothetical protein
MPLLISLMLTVPLLDDWDGLRNALAPVGDLDGDGLEELALQLPVLQELRVVHGSDARRRA